MSKNQSRNLCSHEAPSSHFRVVNTPPAASASKMATAGLPPIIVGNRRLPLDEIAQLAIGRATVELDRAVLAKVESKSRDKAVYEVTAGDLEAIPAASSATYPATTARAAVLAVIAGFMHASSGARPDVLAFLAQLLNHKVNLALPTGDVATTLRVLALAINGEGAVLGETESLRTVCARSGVTLPNPKLLASEMAAITQAEVFVRAVCVITGFQLDRLGRAADAAAAVSMEVADVASQQFDQRANDDRPHKAVQASGMALGGMLLNDSKPKPKRLPHLDDGYKLTPELHGAAMAGIATANRTARVEFSAPIRMAGDGAAVLAGAAHSLWTAAKVLYEAAAARKAVRSGAAPGAGAGDDSDSAEVLSLSGDLPAAMSSCEAATFFAVQASSAVAAVQAALGAELGRGLAQLNAKEAEKVAAADAKDAAKAAKQGKGKGKAAGAEAASDKPLTEKQKKAAAKRAEKARKAAEKAAAKALAARTLHVGGGVGKIRTLLAGQEAEAGAAIDPCASIMGGFYAELQVILNGSSGSGRRKPKIAKGARDFGPAQMQVREKCFGIIRNVFKRHGAVEIDTPVFELRETLMGKYGEEGGKLIYDLADQGGELLSLRYDLTVPFARYLAMHSTGSIKRFHISKVYRRDNPAIARGRYREFYQCDYDIAGNYESMMPDAEVLKVGCEILDDLDIGGFLIKLNHRVLLDAMLDIAGVPDSKFRTICSSIDKLDKEPWAAVKAEMVLEKGLSEAVADTIGEFVKMHNSSAFELLAELRAGQLGKHPRAQVAMKELEVLFGYLEAMDCLQFISFDLSLARGLDYYTGVIYEAVLTSPNMVGSVAAGGRYDNLVGMFSASSKQVPCVGISIGIERIFTIMEAKAKEAGALGVAPVQVLVASTGSGMDIARMKLCATLWKAGITAQMEYASDPNFKRQIHAADSAGNPFMVILGPDEMARGNVVVKPMASETREQFEVPREEMVAKLVELGCAVMERPAKEVAAGAGSGAGAGVSPPPVPSA